VDVLALDFDGVIADSSREALAVARRTFGDLHPPDPLAGRGADELYAAFRELLPLGNRAEDFGVALAAIAAGVPIADQAAYDRFRARHSAQWLERFHRRFYEVRGAMAADDPVGWLALNPPYRRFVELLRRRAGERSYAIATAKDRRSVHALLGQYGIDDLFDDERILDKETGTDKSAHLTTLHERFGVPYDRTTFVDDKVNHLDSVAALGVRCALAAWGYNGPRERRLAERRGYAVCGLEDAERTLFGGP